MRPRTTVTLLEPVLGQDRYTEEPTDADWSQPPTEHPDVPAAVEPLSSTEAVLTADTVIARWICYLPGGTPVEPSWRVRWDGDEYDIDGDVERWQGRRGEEYRSVILKHVEG